MTVLQAAGSLRDWGGIERYVVNLHQGLAEAGVRAITAAPADSPIAQRIAVRAVRTRAKWDPLAVAAYLRVIREVRPSIVHAHFSPDFVAPAIAARMAGKGIRTVLTRHLCLPWRAGQVRGALARWDRIVPVSHAVERVLSASGIPAERMQVAYAGLPDVTSPVPAEPFVAGIFGRLVEEKGVDLAIDAVRYSPSWRLVIYGEGPARAALMQRAEGNPRIEFRGYTPDVADAIAGVSVVLLPSRWEEAFPTSALEAFALARPVVAAAVGGIPEIVTPGTGLLFPREDAYALADCLSSSADWPEMGRAGRHRYESHFRREHFAARMIEVYERLLTSR